MTSEADDTSVEVAEDASSGDGDRRARKRRSAGAYAVQPSSVAPSAWISARQFGSAKLLSHRLMLSVSMPFPRGAAKVHQPLSPVVASGVT